MAEFVINHHQGLMAAVYFAVVEATTLKILSFVSVVIANSIGAAKLNAMYVQKYSRSTHVNSILLRQHKKCPYDHNSYLNIIKTYL